MCRAGRRRSAFNVSFECFDESAQGLAFCCALIRMVPLLNRLVHDLRQALALVNVRLQRAQALIEQFAHLAARGAVLLSPTENALDILEAKPHTPGAGNKAQALQVSGRVLLITVLRIARGLEQPERGVVAHGISADSGGFGQLCYVHNHSPEPYGRVRLKPVGGPWVKRAGLLGNLQLAGLMVEEANLLVLER